MKGFRFLKGAAAGLACLGMLLPTNDLLAAAPKATVAKTTPAEKTPAIVDVALTDGGTLSGYVVDEQGAGLDGAVVSVKQGSEEIAQAVSDKDGIFTVRNLRGGVYGIDAGQGTGMFRAWAPNTAPPSAKDHAVLVSGNSPVRGQFGAVDLITATNLALGITTVTLSAVTLHRVNRVEDKVDQIPTSP